MKFIMIISGFCSCFILATLTIEAQQPAMLNTKPVKAEIPVKIPESKITTQDNIGPNGITATRFEGPKLSQLPVLPSQDNNGNLPTVKAIPFNVAAHQSSELKNIDRPRTATIKPTVVPDPSRIPAPNVKTPVVPVVAYKQAQ